MNATKPDIVFVHLAATGSDFHFEKFFNEVQYWFVRVTTIISGQMTDHYTKKIPPSVQTKRS